MSFRDRTNPVNCSNLDEDFIFSFEGQNVQFTLNVHKRTFYVKSNELAKPLITFLDHCESKSSKMPELYFI